MNPKIPTGKCVFCGGKTDEAWFVGGIAHLACYKNGESMNQVDKKPADALRMRREGKTLSDIGRAIGVSKERARQIVFIEKRREQALLNIKEAPFEVLSTRTRNLLLQEHSRNGNGGCPTPQYVRSILDSGELHKAPGAWKRSIQEIVDWLDYLEA